MELTIDGIGKVCDTRILLEGITLVAGPNNIGKSTIGKTLFALVNSQYDFTIVFNAFVMMTLFNEFNSRKVHGERNVFKVCLQIHYLKKKTRR